MGATDLVGALATALRNQPAMEERWWSPHQWEGAYRTKAKWQASIAAPVDVDWHDKNSFPPPETAAGLESYARTGAVPGSIFHNTPHGCRFVFVLDKVCTDREAMLAACYGAGELVRVALEQIGLGDLYKIDVPLLGDLGRLFFVPTCVAKKQRRQAEVITMRPAPYSVSELGAAQPAKEPDTWTDESAARLHAPIPPASSLRRPSLDEVIARWNTEHPGKWPASNADCPVCKHHGCFGSFPSDATRWACFSSGHPETVGVRGPTCMHGDALDLEAFRRGMRIGEVLRADGYLPLKSAPAPRPMPTVDDEEARRACGTTKPPGLLPMLPKRPLRSGSLLTAVQIIEDDQRDVLGGRKLEYDEMQRAPTFDRQRLENVDLVNVRIAIEARFVGGVDKKGNQLGLKLGADMVQDAVLSVAKRRAFHPVRAYLRSLKWDGKPRISELPEIMTCAKSALNMAMLRKWFISAVARPMDPGCQVHMVLILAGPQATGKSTFFRTLAAPWSGDTNIDVRSKDAFQTIARSWIHEFAELDAMNRRDSETVKAFITSAVDIYRRPYERVEEAVPRSGVIVGTTNAQEFLVDPSGERRYWPIRVNGIDLKALREWRDQLWAEAVVAYDAGEKWELSPEEMAALAEIHKQYAVSDAWDGKVLDWIKDRDVVTVAEILQGALGISIDQWDRTDQMRVGKILQHAGWEKIYVARGARGWRQKVGA